MVYTHNKKIDIFKFHVGAGSTIPAANGQDLIDPEDVRLTVGEREGMAWRPHPIALASRTARLVRSAAGVSVPPKVRTCLLGWCQASGAGPLEGLSKDCTVR
ncbi:hypothetical protein XHV734_1545 [Xanthomonas hortorum pv. vitians]|nr:hypothetical protein XHV734_1545 [Xanthomonas hortorum pv. vitians]